MRLAEGDHLGQALAVQFAHQMFRNSILPRRIRTDCPIAETHGAHPTPENVCVQRR
jgi:hypothetical protein